MVLGEVAGASQRGCPVRGLTLTGIVPCISPLLSAGKAVEGLWEGGVLPRLPLTPSAHALAYGLEQRYPPPPLPHLPLTRPLTCVCVAVVNTAGLPGGIVQQRPHRNGFGGRATRPATSGATPTAPPPPPPLPAAIMAAVKDSWLGGRGGGEADDWAGEIVATPLPSDSDSEGGPDVAARSQPAAAAPPPPASHPLLQPW